jgi:1-acyl-sn-glycerol-3-phosphate acyltransferase
MRSCINTLKEGKVLCIFPEGTRHLEHLMEKIEKGVALLALRQKMDLVPVYIDGKLKPFRMNMAVVGEPIKTTEFFEDGYTEQNADRLVEMVRERFYRLRDMLPNRKNLSDTGEGFGGGEK